jgi:hypothetical protein
LATGNLATAKTVELPVQKMCSSYQKTWADAYRDMCEIVLEHNKVPEDNWFVDLDFPGIAPQDAVASAQTLQALSTVFPSFADSKDIMMSALVSMGINNPAEVLDELEKTEKARKEKLTKPVQLGPDGLPIVTPQEATTGQLIRALKEYKLAVEKRDNGHE